MVIINALFALAKHLDHRTRDDMKICGTRAKCYETSKPVTEK